MRAVTPRNATAPLELPALARSGGDDDHTGVTPSLPVLPDIRSCGIAYSETAKESECYVKSNRGVETVYLTRFTSLSWDTDFNESFQDRLLAGLLKKVFMGKFKCVKIIKYSNLRGIKNIYSIHLEKI